MNFEKTVLFVVVLIILISTANIYTQYLKDTLGSEDGVLEYFDKSKLNMNTEVPTILFKADKLYEEDKYKEAAAEYSSLLTGNKLSTENQKSLANFKLGMCYYRLQKQDYVSAKDSFLKSINNDKGDAVAYNNIAVCYYYLKDYENAKRYEQMAISATPTVEYYYNMGRMYETIEDYDNATKYYQGVIKGEDSITYDDLIDPVRVRNKITSMVPDGNKRAELSKDVIIALKLEDMKEVLLITDTDMDIKSFDFDLKITKGSSGDRLNCIYDREKLDPYHLIKSLSWTVRSGNRTVYRSSKDSINISIDKSFNYSVTLKIEYENKIYTKTRQVNKNQVVENDNREEYNEVSQADQLCKFYISAIYEQLFENDMKISRRGYTDRFGAVWGKDSIETEIMSEDIVDAGSSLYMKNNSDNPAGIWADLSALIQNKNLEGKTVSVRFYSRKITQSAVIKAKMRVKVNGVYKNTNRGYVLDYKWKRFGFDIMIPENASALTFNMQIDPGQEVKLDGFTISITR